MRQDRQIAADRASAEQVRENATLTAYVQQTSDLMLKNSLVSSKLDDPVRSVARTATLTALRLLDGERKGEVVRFLQEAGLIHARGQSPLELVYLTGANLEGANLRLAPLRPPRSQAPISGAPTSQPRTSRAPTSRPRTSRAPTSGAPTSVRAGS